mmetsp:Transcript_17562/g.49596  ORF Transcript_17562/g.49596 Transcript_17562/m.49596 type:complete len:423 (+) Transcript_17562:170-1438(+)|eukprot:CAMPEP_0119559874 /NCGR_PEP_ID=MMETSP1352-20130426/13528_1 /TAXON_ID=265584 /ORGANISM="Stauroneis constricta, Strain CCMP1120" /LENGTH=422 /DNA_ID=CAMNT_0007607691 /DNA_START=113 /DNA_END=1381 /DNA_ORIENTATION=+
MLQATVNQPISCARSQQLFWTVMLMTSSLALCDLPPPPPPAVATITPEKHNFIPSIVSKPLPDRPTSSSKRTLSGKKDSIEKFHNDLIALQKQTGNAPIISATHTSRDSSYTKTWTNDDWEGYQLMSLWRYKSHLLSWPTSPTARGVLPAVLVFVVWTLVVSFVTTHVPIFSRFMEKSSFTMGISSFSSPIALLLALRTNRALNRLLEARSMFGIMARNCASLAGLTSIYATKIDSDKALLIGRYLSIFGWSMKGVVRSEDDQLVYKAMLPPKEVAWIQRNAADTPTCVIFRVRELIASMVGQIPSVAADAMEHRLSELESTMGVCKRLLGSPIPPTYTRHTSRVMCLFLGLLPLALVSAKVAPLSSVIIVALLGYVFIGIDEIGVEVEHPFPLLPIYHLSSIIQRNVFYQYAMMEHEEFGF